MFNGPYVLINQLIRSIWKDAHFKNSLLYMLGGKKYQSNKKWLRLGLLKIWPKSSHSKAHSYLFVKFFVVISFNSIFSPSCASSSSKSCFYSCEYKSKGHFFAMVDWFHAHDEAWAAIIHIWVASGLAFAFTKCSLPICGNDHNDYAYLQSILISCGCIPNLNMLFWNGPL